MEIKELEIKDRIINLFSDIDEYSIRDTIEKISELNIKDSDYIAHVCNAVRSLGFQIDESIIGLPPIILNLSTLGGYCYDGLGLCDAIRCSATPIKIICYGKIMSMGIPILLSAKYKAAHKNTIFMIHGISGGNVGKAEYLRNSMDETNRLEQQVIDYILEHSKFPKKKMNDIIKSQQDYYFTAEEALKYKIIDEIVE